MIVRKDDYRKMTRELMDVVFTHEEMQCSSVTGRKGAGRETASKPSLDSNKTALIICEFRCTIGDFMDFGSQ